jgi:hypothetical protein
VQLPCNMRATPCSYRGGGPYDNKQGSQAIIYWGAAWVFALDDTAGAISAASRMSIELTSTPNNGATA